MVALRFSINDSTVRFKFKLVFFLCCLITLVIPIFRLFLIWLKLENLALQCHHLLLPSEVLLRSTHWQSILGHIKVPKCLVVVLFVSQEVFLPERPLSLCVLVPIVWH